MSGGRKIEYSFGVIPLQKNADTWRALLVRHAAGHWAFPKGHAEKGEVPHETATRELFEETGLSIVQFLPGGPFEEHYFFKREGQRIEKKVEYYPAQVTGTLSIQVGEIVEARWFSLEDIESHATFAQTKQVCRHLFATLMSLPSSLQTREKKKKEKWL